MTREEARQAAEVMMAYAEGREVEYYDVIDECWDSSGDLGFNWFDTKYRVKPEPKYRPFKTKEECWEEMLKHQPFGWVKDGSKYAEIVNVFKNDIEFSPDDDDNGVLFRCFMTFESVLNQDYTFIDGTPFGIKEE